MSPYTSISDTSGVSGSAHTTPRRPGRPRAARHDETILTAALELVDSGQAVTVTALVRRSGVSRGAIYRRWPSLTLLTAEALDQGRTIPPTPGDRPVLNRIVDTLLGDDTLVDVVRTETRIRRRLQLAIADKDLQRTYWAQHVLRRRRPLLDILELGTERGELRDDLDLDACIDLINGVFYYQLTARGEFFDDCTVRARCRTALEVAVRGMST